MGQDLPGQGQGLTPVTPWYRAYRDMIVAKENKTAAQMAAKSN